MDSVRDECASGMLGDNIMPQDRKFSFPDIQWLLAGISFDATSCVSIPPSVSNHGCICGFHGDEQAMTAGWRCGKWC